MTDEEWRKFTESQSKQFARMIVASANAARRQGYPATHTVAVAPCDYATDEQIAAMTFPELAEELEKQQAQTTTAPVKGSITIGDMTFGSWGIDQAASIGVAPPPKPAEPSAADKPIHEMQLDDYRRGVARCWPKMGWM